MLWEYLAGGTLLVARFCLSLFYRDLVSDLAKHHLGTPAFAVAIEEACSGYEGIGMILVFFSAYLWTFRERLRFPHVLLVLPVGALVIWLANAVRIAALIAIGSSDSPEVAMNGFHSQAGWIAFNLVALGLIVVTERTGWVHRKKHRLSETKPGTTTAAYLMPFLALLAATMVATAIVSKDWVSPVRVLVVVPVLWSFRATYARLPWSWSWPAFLLGVATFGLWVALAPADPERVGQVADTLDRLPPLWSGLWLTCRLLAYVLLVPLVEELAFRGFLTRRLIAADVDQVAVGRFSWVSLLGSSVAFGLLHGVNWLPGILAGILFAVALYRRGRLCDAVLAHGTTNGLLAVYAILTGQWDAFS